MNRVRSTQDGVIHFVHPCDVRYTLCAHIKGDKDAELFGEVYHPWPSTSDPVTCPDCAKVVCAIRNEPYNTLLTELTEDALYAGMAKAVERMPC